MLPSKNRLKLPVKWDRNRADFQFRTDFFKLISKKVAVEEEPKVGFIITTKVGKATVRNALKRKLVASIGPHLEKLSRGVEIIFIAYPTLAKAKDEDISASVDKALSKIYF